jgi:GntR family transcriptional regulator / MocR family aminotransferase
VGETGTVGLYLPLDRASRPPLQGQIYAGLRSAILDGRLLPGRRLPASRALAADLGVSRNTVKGAYLRLTGEGYVRGRTGSGTYVVSELPEALLRPDAGLPERPVARRVAVDEPPPGRPAPASGGDARPHPPRRWLVYGDPAGYRPLREAIADHLRSARAVSCSWERVVVVSGSQQALDLCARVLLDPGDEAWVEEPGYPGAKGAFSGAGAKLVPVPVDGEGLDVAAGERLAPGARLAFVSPSHQYPTGVTMSLSRRLALLDWAERRGSWVVEDDYDGEYRYAGAPLPALQGLDEGFGEAGAGRGPSSGRVVYVGTFSKVLYPALRLGFLVAPPDLVEAFVVAKELADRQAPTMEQAVLADFISEGHLATHLRRTRALHARRGEALASAIRARMGGLLEAEPPAAGLHLLARLAGGGGFREGSEGDPLRDDRRASEVALRVGVEALPLSAFHAGPPARPGGLVLGYAGFAEDEIFRAVERLEGAFAARGRG